MVKCDNCQRLFDAWSAKSEKIGRKLHLYCPHCGALVRVK